MAISQWPMFLRQCLLRRVNGEDFGDMVILMYKRSRVPGVFLVRLFLKCQTSFCIPVDPLLIEYLQKIIALGLVNISDVLVVLIRSWNKVVTSDGEDPNFSVSMEQYTMLLNQLSVMLSSASITLSKKEAQGSLTLCSRWLDSLTMFASKDPRRMNDLSTMALLEAVGILIATIASTGVGMTILGHENVLQQDSKSINDDKQAEPSVSLQKALKFSLPLFSAVSPSLQMRLHTLQSHINMQQGTNTSDNLEADTLQFQRSVMDGPPVAARASLFFYLDVLRCKCATIDESRILSFLNSRHTGDHAAMFTDLIIASFDVLRCSGNTESDRRSLDRWCSFIVNKLPTMLSVISASSFGTFVAEDSISDALNISGPDIAAQHYSVTLSSVRAKFVQVCSLHRLVSKSDVHILLRDRDQDLMQSPVLYAKDDLISQIRGSPQKGVRLLGSLKNLDGNAGTIAAAITETVMGYCQSKETALLKEIAYKFLREPVLIDLISLYVRPAFILSPICNLLDDWRWEDLHGETQPLYDDFGGILLLVEAFRHRLSLADADIPTSTDTSFVRRFLQESNNEQNPATMTENTSKHLGEWLNALFIAEGLSDETMSSCSPQDFYLMVPTLLSQSLTACDNGKLSLDTLKSGFEYLLEPVLLPSLVPAISWLTSPAAQRHNQSHVSQLLLILIKGPTASEAREIHKTILGIVSKDPGLLAQDLLEAGTATKTGNMNAKFETTVAASAQDIRIWSVTPGGLLGNIETTVNSLAVWISTNIDLMPPPSSGYAKLNATLEIYGPKEVLEAIMSILLEPHDYTAALDLVATIICSLDQLDSTTTLFDALRLEQQNLALLLKEGKKVQAGSVIRLSRRVDLLSVVVTQPEMSMDAVASLIPELTEADIHNIELGTTQNNPEGENENLQSQQDDSAQDIDQMLDAAAAMGSMDQTEIGETSNMDDMFNLDTDDMGLVNFDDLDMEGMF